MNQQKRDELRSNEGQNAECPHTDNTGLCYCESGALRCPDCKTWLGRGHARKDIGADIAVMWPKPIATSVVEECECGEKL